MLNSALERVQIFIKERNWHSYHHPKNLAISLMDEIGELSEHFAYPFKDTWSESKREEIAYEMADVLHYLLSFCLFFQISPDTDLPSFCKRSRPLDDLSLQSFPLNLVVCASKLIKFTLWLSDEESQNLKLSSPFKEALFKTLQSLIEFASVLAIDLEEASAKKMKLNKQKYPANKVRNNVEQYYLHKQSWTDKTEQK